MSEKRYEEGSRNLNELYMLIVNNLADPEKARETVVAIDKFVFNNRVYFKSEALSYLYKYWTHGRDGFDDIMTILTTIESLTSLDERAKNIRTVSPDRLRKRNLVGIDVLIDFYTL
jgi:hypothetical protein